MPPSGGVFPDAALCVNLKTISVIRAGLPTNAPNVVTDSLGLAYQALRFIWKSKQTDIGASRGTTLNTPWRTGRGKLRRCGGRLDRRLLLLHLDRPLQCTLQIVARYTHLARVRIVLKQVRLNRWVMSRLRVALDANRCTVVGNCSRIVCGAPNPNSLHASWGNVSN